MNAVASKETQPEDNVVPLGARALPANIEAEAALIGAVLIDNGLWQHITNMVRPEDFFEPVHQRLIASIARHIDAGRKVTPILLKPEFEADEALKELGGVSYLARLTADGQGTLIPRELAGQIADLARRRTVVDLGRGLVEGALAADEQALPVDDLRQWFEENAARLTVSRSAFPALDLEALAKVEAKPMTFAINGLVPSGETTFFTGPGSAGKSLLAQQLATAAAAGIDCLGLDVHRSNALYVTCEDGADQLHWRQAHICRSLGLSYASLAGKLNLISLRGELGNELCTFGPDGRMYVTPSYHRLAQSIRESRSKIAWLDNVAHLFTGNENDRGNVTHFINLLNRLAGETGAAIVLLGHPNKAGDEWSGSTAWPNAVRSRIYLEHDEEQDIRTLRASKANYARKGEAARFRWHDWAFVRDEDLPADIAAEMQEVSRANFENSCFLACLHQRNSERRAVSEKACRTYAPKVFATMPEARGCTQEQLTMAMDRLFRIKAIERGFLWRDQGEGKDVYGLRERGDFDSADRSADLPLTTGEGGAE